MIMQIDTSEPLKRISVEKGLYELKQFEFVVVNPYSVELELDVSLQQSCCESGAGLDQPNIARSDAPAQVRRLLQSWAACTYLLQVL